MKKITTNIWYIYLIIMVSMAVGILIGGKISAKQTKYAIEEKSQPDIQGLNVTQNNQSFIQTSSQKLNESSMRDLKSTKLAAVAENHASSRVDRWTKNYEKQYVNELSEYGINEISIPHIIELRKKLVELANMDKVYRQMMQKERFEYLKTIQENTTPEQYAKYIDNEKLKPSKKEIDNMENEGIYIKTDLTNDQKNRLEQLITQHKLVTQVSFDGPMDPLPNPLVGKERVLENIRNQYANISDKLPKMLQQLENEGIDEIVIQNLDEYYGNKMVSLQTSYENIVNKRELTSEEIEQQAMQTIMEDKHRREIQQRVTEQYNNIIKRP